MLIEGQKFFKPEIISWLIENKYKLKIYYLSVDINNLNQRANHRGGWWDKKRTDTRTSNEIKRLNKILDDKSFKDVIEQRENKTMEHSIELSDKILNILRR